MHILAKAAVLGAVTALVTPVSALALLDGLEHVPILADCAHGGSGLLCDLHDLPTPSLLDVTNLRPDLTQTVRTIGGTVPAVLNGLPDVVEGIVPQVQLGEVPPLLSEGGSAPEIDPAAARGALALVLGALAMVGDRRRR